MLEIEQQARQDREERAMGQAQITKELIRNLAHEIKNPLGGIRAAQLLAMDLPSPSRPSTPRSSSTRPTACRPWWTACWRRTASRM
jgi:nitrogen-specific signal transduction histidine kinase